MRARVNLPAVLPCLAGLWLNGCGAPLQTAPEPVLVAGEPAGSLDEFERILEEHRARLNIPGLGAAIVKDRQVVWAAGFGYANRERGVRATADTPFHLASLTKTFASTVIMQLVEEGTLDLEAPVSEFGIQLQGPGTVRVKHLLTHTSEGVPGDRYQYNGARFGLLDTVVEVASGVSFCELLADRILRPLELPNTAPNPLAVHNCYFPSAAQEDAFQQRMAQGYTSDGRTPIEYPDYFGTAAGLVASARDVATYSIAIDQGRFLRPQTQEQVFTPAISNSGQTLPYGLGWFVQSHPRGVRIAWHYGYWTANSSLIVKVLDRQLAFVLLANSDLLSRASPGIGTDADVERSAWASEFLNAFVFGDAALPNRPVQVQR